MKYDDEDMWVAFCWGFMIASAISGEKWLVASAGGIAIASFVWFEIYRTPKELEASE